MRARSTAAILCQLAAEDTLVPPNLSTTQASLFFSTQDRTCEFISSVAHPSVCGGDGNADQCPAPNRLRKCRAALFLTGARRVHLPHGSRLPCRALRRPRLWGAARCAPAGDRSR